MHSRQSSHISSDEQSVDGSFLFFFFFLKERRWTKVNIRAEAKTLLYFGVGNPTIVIDLGSTNYFSGES